MRFAAAFIVFIAFSAFAADKADQRTLDADYRCHFIIQGARLDQLSWLTQQGRCVNWTAYAKYPDHLAALKLYRAEVEKAWPGNSKPWDLIRDLKIIDSEDKR